MYVVLDLSTDHPSARWPLEAGARYVRMVHANLNSSVVLVGGVADCAAGIVLPCAEDRVANAMRPMWARRRSS